MQKTPKYLEILKIVIQIISGKRAGIELNACLIAINIPNQDYGPFSAKAYQRESQA
jgi:hypothetical protein